MTEISAKASSDDFRVRVAREKRERMRRRLQEAAVHAFSTMSLTRQPVIDDIINQAQVSRGTFYKYYDSLDALLVEIGDKTAADTLQTYQSISRKASPAAKLLCGPVFSMVHAGMEPAKAAITARLDFEEFFARQNSLKKILSSALVKAASDGVIRYESLGAATDFVVGITLEGMRRIARRGEARRSYIKELVAMIARGLNMSEADFERAFSESWTMLLAKSDKLEWWNLERLPVE